jgi:hypothetical protein
MQFTLKSATLFALLAFVAGCLHLEQEINLKNDNSGKFRIFFSVPRATADKFADPENSQHLAWRQLFDIRSGQKLYGDGSGLSVTRYRVFDRDARRHVRIEGRIDDLERALASGKLGTWKLESVGDNTRLTARLPESADLAGEDARGELWDGLYLNLIVTVPGTIVDTSASESRNNRAKWTFDTGDTKDFLRQPPRIYVEFKD